LILALFEAVVVLLSLLIRVIVRPLEVIEEYNWLPFLLVLGSSYEGQNQALYLRTQGTEHKVKLSLVVTYCPSIDT
jgi:hypothetical protein